LSIQKVTNAYKTYAQLAKNGTDAYKIVLNMQKIADACKLYPEGANIINIYKTLF
jgi:hypothetical protein